MHTILLYYKYIHIANPEALAQSQREVLSRLNMKGRVIVSTEGINGTAEGAPEAVDEYMDFMRRDKNFADFSNIHFKKSRGTPDGTAFKKLSVKVRKEIVSSHLGEKDIDPTQVTGKRLKPEELHSWYETGREFAIVDMRNDYEHTSGHFRNSTLPSLRNFRDLKDVVDKELVPAGLKKKTVLTVCTGGVRCEKASGYLVSQGFDDVYQLDGGIVSYMEKFPGKDFLGSLYVFDGRVTMNFGNNEIIGQCKKCAAKTERYVNCSNSPCHKHFICCVGCAPDENKVLCGEC